MNRGPYKVEPVTKAGHTEWVVRCPDGRIASGEAHPTPDQAEQHADLCNVLWDAWRKKPENQGEQAHA